MFITKCGIFHCQTMWFKFNSNLKFFTLIVLAVTQNLVVTQAPAPISADENVINIQSPQHFKDVALNSKDNVIVQYHAPWCTPCNTLGPLLIEKVVEKNGKIKLARVDMSNTELTDFAKTQGVRSVPILHTYKNGQLIDELIGFKDQNTVVRFVEKQLEN